ncbi:4Fe-4S ferredoxin-type domain-containing protein [Candidatus Electrothrix aarhusensis]
MSEKKKNRLLPIRRAVQGGMLLLLGQWSFYGLFRCPFAVPFVSCQSCPVITCWGRVTSLFWGFWLSLPIIGLLFGRAFCGWGCPGGLISQLSAKIAPFKGRGTGLLNRFAPYGKYLALLTALVLWLFLNNPRWAIPIRIGEFINSIRLTFEHAETAWLIRTLTVLGFLTAGLVFSNLWCRFACPTGGLLELFKRTALFSFHTTEECNDCNACRDACDMGTRPAESNCTNCGDCQSACPRNALQFGRLKRKQKKKLLD